MRVAGAIGCDRGAYCILCLMILVVCLFSDDSNEYRANSHECNNTYCVDCVSGRENRDRSCDRYCDGDGDDDACVGVD